eukprot:7024938-Alexandrium_andersonii.AAC.1
MGRSTHRVAAPPSQSQIFCPPPPPWEVTIPARPTGQTALSVARNLQKFGAPLFRGGRRRRRASR